MTRRLAFAVLLLLSVTGCTSARDQPREQPASLPQPFSYRVLTSGLSSPWEITSGPDGQLWITEREGRKVVRVNPSDGSVSTVADIPEVYAAAGQDGLLGMAFHPGFLQRRGTDFVYLAYTYDANPGAPVDRRAKIVRYTYHPDSAKLADRADLITGLPASEDHNAGRLLFGPDQKLYYGIGDQGNNQFERYCLPIRAQDLPTAADVARHNWSSYVGKILRLDLDGGVPSDNPVIHGVRSHVYSYGHRNPQGIVFGPGGRLFDAEHGPKTDDEINLIRPGKNYGWPNVVGFRDDQAYDYANWSASTRPPCTSLHFSDYDVPPSVPQRRETEWNSPDFVEPLKTIYTVPNGYNFQDPACGEASDICWPSIAPAGMDFVPPDADTFDGWRNALLVTSLKNGTIYGLRLTADGGWVQGDITQYFKTTNRYRDLTLSSDHRTVYVVTDSSGVTGPQSGPPTERLDNPGAVLEFKYVAQTPPRASR